MNTTKTKQRIKKTLQKIRLRYIANKDIKKFSKSASFSLFDDKYDQLTARIIYNVHAIEKGLSRDQNIRLGFGKKALSDLNDALVIYEKKGYNKDSFAYQEGRSIIYKYQSLHEEKEYNTNFLEDFISEEFLKKNFLYNVAGTKKIYEKEKQNNNRKNFYELSQGRSSIREFSGDPIDMNKIFRAIKNAEKTPSVCNRQGWKVHIVQSKDKMESLLYYQRGFKGYATLPEAVLVITVTNNSFLSPVERNEAFVDGGLFSMSVLYGIEHEGLAAVPLNAMLNTKDEKKVREITGLDYSESIILFIAIGNFKEETTVPISDRKSNETFTKII